MAATFSSRATDAIRSNNLGNDPGGFRTHDLRIKSPLLYQLSYRILTAFKIPRAPRRVSGLRQSVRGRWRSGREAQSGRRGPHRSLWTTCRDARSPLLSREAGKYHKSALVGA